MKAANTFSIDYADDSPIVRAMFQHKADEFRILASKNRAYGPDAISATPYGPLTGINVRLFDKVMRAVNLERQPEYDNSEPLRDTYTDIANYGTIATMLLNGKWTHAAN